MSSRAETRAFMALLSIGQHFGRPYTDRPGLDRDCCGATVKAENPHLLAIDDPAVLAAELDWDAGEHNAVRLYEGIGYVTPDDEHEGVATPSGKTRRDGLTAADQALPGSPPCRPQRRAVIMNIHTPPVTTHCGLITSRTCREESDTPH